LWENSGSALEWRLPSRPLMSESNAAEAVLAWLWELPDGTKAAVVEHPAAPRWELRVTRRGRVLERERCDSFFDLISASMAARLKADADN
jgi:hypothetical protein